MSTPPLPTDLQPRGLIDELRHLPSAQVELQYAGVQFLLVELRDDAPDLDVGLNENQTLAGCPPRPSTVSAATTVTFPVLRATGNRDSLEGMDRIQLLSKLSGSRYFVLPLFKRQGASQSAETQLTVGRNKGNDVMLCHPSVSKLHAWFEADNSGALYLFDAKSLNGTRVNGKPLVPEEPQWLQPMDHLQFGSISAFTCTPLVLRSVVRTLSGPGQQDGLLELP